MNRAAPRKVLVAVRPQDTDLVLAALGTTFSLLIVHDSVSFEQALAEDDVGLIICGVHFDEGRMFDLLRQVKSDPAVRNIPFVPVLGEPSNHSDGIRQGIRSAALSLGADNFVDLLELANSPRLDDAYARLRELVRRTVE